MKTKLSLVALALGAVACGGDEPGRVDVSGAAVDVVVTSPVRSGAMTTYAAEVRSERSVDIATRMSGTVRQVHVDLGTRVRAGDLLISLDADDVAARVRAARAAFALAEKNHGRIERLAEEGAASTLELDRSLAGLEAARSALAEAEAQEAYVVVRAPFDGVITARRVDAGDLANPGVPLLSMVDPGAIKIVADLPGHLVGSFQEGAEVEVELVGAGGPVGARVIRVVPAVRSQGRTFRLEARTDVLLEGAYPGAYARLGVPADDATSSWIPADAVVERGQLRGVFVVEDGVLRLRWVRLGVQRAGAVELLSGPGGELQVVRRPGVGLSDGLPVGTVREETWALGEAAGEEMGR
ncbi:MAG: efflux RND transporter periplasmic adaptor subunit [Gemmatimonadota bacterium]